VIDSHGDSVADGQERFGGIWERGINHIFRETHKQ
jgi:hypothetical protein